MEIIQAAEKPHYMRYGEGIKSERHDDMHT